MEKLYFGVDIGGTEIKFGIFTESGERRKQWAMPTDTENGGSRIIPAIAQAIAQSVPNLDIIGGVGVGVPGPVLASGFVERCVDLHWGNFNPAAELNALLGVPVFAGNDANLAALGETWLGGGQKYESAVFITLGTGVGSGIILNGKILPGRHGLGGEIGHTVVDPSEPLPCNCGHHGCLDQFASASGVVRIAQRIMRREFETHSEMRGIHPLTAKDVFDCAKAGDALAEEAVDFCMGLLGRSLSTVSYIVDPDVFIIGGGVSKAGDYLLNIVRRHYEAHATLADGKADVVLATLGNDAGIAGAAKIAIDGAKAEAS